MNYQLKTIAKPPYDRMSNALRVRTDMTGSDKLVYTYMLNEYQVFKEFNRTYSENMSDIAFETGLTRRTVGVCIERLNALGLVKTEKHSVHDTSKSIVYHTYVVVDLYNVFSN